MSDAPTDALSRRGLLKAAIAAGIVPATHAPSWAAVRERRTPGIAAPQLAADRGGSGPPALFVHGFGSSKYTWRSVCAGLTDVFAYHAIDMPGAGSSPAPANFNFALENLSDVLAQYIVSNDLKNLTIVSSSLGAAIAFIAILRNFPSLSTRVSSLCVIDGACYPQRFPFFIDLLRWPIVANLSDSADPPQEMAEFLARTVLGYLFFDASRITEEQVQEYTGYITSREHRRAIAQIARALDMAVLSRYVPLLKTIKIPTLIIWGDEDRVIPVANGRRLERDLGNAHFFAIERCGHLPQEERPDEVIALMRRYHKPV
jgi:pimeloyl-ACP methyl ester carboxylesterase